MTGENKMDQQKATLCNTIHTNSYSSPCKCSLLKIKAYTKKHILALFLIKLKTRHLYALYKTSTSLF